MSLSVTVVAPAPVDAAWERLADIDGWPGWNPSCRSAGLDGPLAPGTRLALQLVHPRGRSFWTRPTLTAVDPPHTLAWEARSLGLRAGTRARLTPERDGGTRVTLTAEATGAMAFTYLLTLSEPAQADMWTSALNGLSRSFGGGG
jgi:uncharacterized protein YndB with AHSA1/START domain